MESFYSILDNSHFNPENDKSNDILEDEFKCDCCGNFYEKQSDVDFGYEDESICMNCFENE